MNTSATALDTLSDPFATEEEWLDAHSKLDKIKIKQEQITKSEQQELLPVLSKKPPALSSQAHVDQFIESVSGTAIGVLVPLFFEPFGAPWVLLHLFVAALTVVAYFQDKSTLWTSACGTAFLVNAIYIILQSLG